MAIVVDASTLFALLFAMFVGGFWLGWRKRARW